MSKKQQRNLDSFFTVSQHPVYQIQGMLISMSVFQGQLNNYKINRLSLIIQLNIVLNRTVVVDSDWCFDDLCSSHFQSQSELYHASWWYYTLVVDLIGPLHRGIIGRLSVKQWCYWLWRLMMQLVRFYLSIVTVKQTSIVSQIVRFPVVVS